jgi:hypothetical protein
VTLRARGWSSNRAPPFFRRISPRRDAKSCVSHRPEPSRPSQGRSSHPPPLQSHRCGGEVDNAGACHRGRAHAPASAFACPLVLLVTLLCYRGGVARHAIPLSEQLPQVTLAPRSRREELFALSFSPAQFADLPISAHCPILKLLQTKSPATRNRRGLQKPTAKDAPW